MPFKLTDRKIISQEDRKTQDWEFLDEDLVYHQRRINHIPWYKLWSPAFVIRVRYVVFKPQKFYDSDKYKPVQISIVFNKKDFEEKPDVYGEDFRENCINYALNRADAMLDADKTNLLIAIVEDPDRESILKQKTIEERFYVRGSKGYSETEE